MKYIWSLVGALFFTPQSFAISSLPACSMRSICEQFETQKDNVYFYSNELNQRVPNYALLKSRPRLASANQKDPFLNPRLFAKPEFKPALFAAQSRLQGIFLETKSSVLNVVEKKRSTLSAEDFENLVNRLKSVRLATSDEAWIRSLEGEACSRPNAIYVAGKHALFVCPGMMNFPEMTLHKIIAHELGHVIDPCTLSYAQNSIVGIPLQRNPLQPVVQCLQSKESIQSGQAQAGHSPHDRSHRSQHAACAKINPQDQTEEVFADWVASEVVAAKVQGEEDPAVSEKKALESQLLFLSVACFSDQSRENRAQRSHPSIQKRIERIFLAQTAFQEAFRCQNVGVKHCE